MPAPKPRLYLITPPTFVAERDIAEIAACLEAGDVACVRLWLAGADAAAHREAAAALRTLRDDRPRDSAFALLATDAAGLAADEDFDGVHFAAAGSDLAAARERLGDEAVIGVAAGASRHLGIVAGERGADYVSFGPITADSALHDGEFATAELFNWWQDMIELPVVAEGGVTLEHAATLTGLTDFIALGPEIWSSDDGPAAAIGRYQAAIDAAGETAL